LRRNDVATNPEQKKTVRKPAPKKPAAAPKTAAKPAAEKEALARVSKLTSRGSEYTQLWVPRAVGEKLTKGDRYTVHLGDGGRLVFLPVNEKAS
jgi:hypothetical protein